MKQYVIYFQSKVLKSNVGFFYRDRKEGFTSVLKSDRARKFKTEAAALARLRALQEKEGEYYDFKIEEIPV